MRYTKCKMLSLIHISIRKFINGQEPSTSSFLLPIPFHYNKRDLFTNAILSHELLFAKRTRLSKTTYLLNFDQWEKLSHQRGKYNFKRCRTSLQVFSLLGGRILRLFLHWQVIHSLYLSFYFTLSLLQTSSSERMCSSLPARLEGTSTAALLETNQKGPVPSF